MPPFVLCLLDSGEVRLFRDLRSLESAIEAIDVVNHEYLAYDSTGVVVDLIVDSLGAPKASVSSLGAASDLEAWILNNYRSVAKISGSQTLPEMIGALKSIYRYDDSRQ